MFMEFSGVPLVYGIAQTGETSRIYHCSRMQIEKSQPEGKRIMPETRFTKFQALSVDLRVWISGSAMKADD